MFSSSPSLRLNTISSHLTSNISTMNDNDICIISYSRTPQGSFNGSLSSLSAPDLASVAIKGALRKANISPDKIDEVFLGNVLSTGIGQAPAKQAAVKSGLKNTCPCTTVNKVCASGMKAIMFGMQSIQLGYNNIVITGGMENMSNVPYILPKARTGLRMGNSEIVDTMIHDGLWCPYNDCHMGIAAEKCAKEFNISREDQDNYCLESYKRAKYASEKGLFNNEIEPVEINNRGNISFIKTDEEFSKVNINKVSSLRPAFQKDGTVTAANASSISDGAAIIILSNVKTAKSLNLPIKAIIRSSADACQDPMDFTTTPAKVIPIALERAGIEQKNVDYYEINEAFSVVALANMKILNIHPSKINIYGGGVSIGHPIGCSGSRIVVTLLNVLENTNSRIGVAAICNGGGGASALVIERIV